HLESRGGKRAGGASDANKRVRAGAGSRRNGHTQPTEVAAGVSCGYANWRATARCGDAVPVDVYTLIARVATARNHRGRALPAARRPCRSRLHYHLESRGGKRAGGASDANKRVRACAGTGRSRHTQPTEVAAGVSGGYAKRRATARCSAAIPVDVHS